MTDRSITEELAGLLKKKNVDFMSLTKSALSETLKKRLGLTKDPTVPQIEKAVSPYQSELLKVKLVKYGKGKRLYLVKVSDEDLLLGIIQKQGGKTPSTNNTPFEKDEYAEVMNRLLKQGRVSVKLSLDSKQKFVPLLSAVPSIKVFDRENEFHAAFRKLERGLLFVKIYELRRTLRWPGNDFDAMLRTLRDEGKIGLHVADPAVMTADEVKDCFLDESGIRMGTITWQMGA